MNIITHYNTLLNYSIDPNYFQKHEQIKVSNYDSFNWRPTNEADNYTFYYNNYLTAKAYDSDSLFINFHHQVEIRCVIENFENDAMEILKIKHNTNIMMCRFLKENTLSFYHLLNFNPMVYIYERPNNEDKSTAEFLLDREIKSIKRALGVFPFDEMNEEEKAISKISNGYEFRNL